MTTTAPTLKQVQAEIKAIHKRMAKTGETFHDASYGLLTKSEPCPNHRNHTEAPDYMAWPAWVERMQQTHEQQRCPGCSRWAIWVHKSNPDAVEP